MDKNYKPSERQKKMQERFSVYGERNEQNILQKADAGKKRCRRG